MAPNAATNSEAIERARQSRVADSEAREQLSQQRLRDLQQKWKEADKKVELRRDEAYVEAGERVGAWKVKRGAAMERTTAADAQHEKRMMDSWKVKSERYESWKKSVEEEKQRKAEEVAASRHAALSRKEEEDRGRSSRLEDAQRLATARRLAMEQRNREKLEEIRERAEQREEEAWAARKRVEAETRGRIALIEADCKRKAKQAADCLNNKFDSIEGRRRDPTRTRSGVGVWRVPGSRENP